MCSSNKKFIPVSNKLKKNNNRNGHNRVRHELDAQGLVPLPAATCFYCRKSCKKAPLISCDYCPLFFHQVKQQIHFTHSNKTVTVKIEHACNECAF